MNILQCLLYQVQKTGVIVDGNMLIKKIPSQNWRGSPY
ncbi:hypothetical protein SYNTR_1133 [Candidatus Syntrophocurvum alkaliphilum]|uniref:Uncharacterized protein n=1 Tax=Candidatus Syntrophocurvum alkaliphilum TaxID=2293317 RepID=A0A6I6DEV9_9FIRM|nr:hypothetical protein SYNTR_1133 [Candidatus Syntrophocurvum alkaliphilum]